MEDLQIVQLYWDRDQQAIACSKEKYGIYCFTVANHILDNFQDSEECVSDTWLSAWNAMPPHRPSILSAFLGKLTRNVSLNRYKYNTAGKRGGGTAPAVLDELAELVSDADPVEQEIDRRELLKAIDGVLAQLPAEKRGMFVRRYWYFDSVSQIASRFGTTENRVSVTLHRLRSKLHDHLLKGGFAL